MKKARREAPGRGVRGARTARWRGLLLATVVAFVMSSVIVTSPTVSAETLSDFSAPLLGTTATAQLTRAPDARELSCTRGCASGLFRGPAYPQGVSYVTPGPAAWGVLSSSPALAAKVSRFYFGDHDQSAAVTLIQTSSGADTAATVLQIAKDDNVSSRKLAKTQATGGWTLWTSADVAVGGGSSRKAAYAGRPGQIVRVACTHSSSASSAGECTNVGALALTIAQKQPSVPQIAANLLPAGTPTGVTSQVADLQDSAGIWGQWLGGPASFVSALGPLSSTLEWSVAGAPALTLSGVLTTLTSTAPLGEFLATLCTPSTKTKCSVIKDLPASVPAGVQASAASFYLEPNAAPSAIEVQLGGMGKMVDLGCAVKDGFTRAMTAREISACRGAISSVAGAIWGS